MPHLTIKAIRSFLGHHKLNLHFTQVTLSLGVNMSRLLYLAPFLFILVAAQEALHPLDPLTEAEITATVHRLQAHLSGNWSFNSIVLKEPEKSLLLPYFLSDTNPPISEFTRKSFTVVREKGTTDIYEAVVNLDSLEIESWVQAPPGVQAILRSDEINAALELARLNPQIIERCRLLGWTNMSLVNVDPWSMGYVEDNPVYAGKRLLQMYLYGKHSDYDNQYAHPFDFGVVYNLVTGEMVEIIELPTHEDFDGSNKDGNEVPLAESNFDPELRDPDSYRKDLKPVGVVQDGTSYTFENNVLSWQKYKMRLGFNVREGLIIHNLNYNDSGTVRPLFYRMSLAEMFVPYGDPRPPYYRKHVFDEGQYSNGYTMSSLEEGMDCIGNVEFFDALLFNEDGDIVPLPRAVCIYEEDSGILWKHYDEYTGRPVVVRSQRLALTFICTIGNYDYVFTWRFQQDASIEFNVKLTGILSTNLLAVNATPGGWGSEVMSQVNAQYHQHFFSLRLDAEIDGNDNSVTVSDVISGPGSTGSPTNPYGQAWTTQKVTFDTAASSRTNVDIEKSRVWIVTNPNKMNPHTKQPVGWKLMPHPSPPMMYQQDSPIRPFAAWMDYHTWVVPYQENQLFPGGFYVNKSGLPEWVANNPNANVANTDIVLWHNFGVSHVPRVEDFPVMPAEQISIFLKPYNFFTENPAVDVPQPTRLRKKEL